MHFKMAILNTAKVSDGLNFVHIEEQGLGVFIIQRSF